MSGGDLTRDPAEYAWGSLQCGLSLAAAQKLPVRSFLPPVLWDREPANQTSQADD